MDLLFRIQSVYLITAAIFLSLNFGVLPFWSYAVAGNENSAMSLYALSAFGTGGGLASGLFIAFNGTLILSAALSLVSIFFFNARKTQMQWILTAMLLILLTLVLGIATGFTLSSRISASGEGLSSLPAAGLYLIAVAAVLLWLARNAVQSDDRIANAYKRL